MKFEDIVYRCPGEHSLPGGSYAYRGVKSEEELEKALSEGWFNTIGEAVEGKHLPKVDAEKDEREKLEAEQAEKDRIAAEEKAKKDAESTPPTREEMEVKAKELGVKFDGRTSDEKLLERINEKLEG